MSRDTGYRLSGNPDFYDWLVAQGPGDSLPSRLELAWRQINSRNMNQKLYSLYMWQAGNNFSRRSYLMWLYDLVDWYDRYTGSESSIGIMAAARPGYSGHKQQSLDS